MSTSIRINSEEKIAYVSTLPNHFTVVFSSGIRLELSAEQIESIIEKREQDLALNEWLNERHLERISKNLAK